MARATTSLTGTWATTGIPVTSVTSRAVRLRPGSCSSTIPSGGLSWRRVAARAR
jgi:hypothetical protein